MAFFYGAYFHRQAKFIWSLRPLGTCLPRDFELVPKSSKLAAVDCFGILADMVYLGVFCGGVLLYSVERLYSSCLLFPSVLQYAFVVC